MHTPHTHTRTHTHTPINYVVMQINFFAFQLRFGLFRTHNATDVFSLTSKEFL